MLQNEVVICGPPRSGTTALCCILNSHHESFMFNESGCYITPKEDFASHLAIKMAEKDFVSFLGDRNIDINSIKYDEPSEIPSIIARENNIAVVGDKLPSAVLLPEVIATLGRKPNMKFIFTIRDYRDVIASSLRAYSSGKRLPWTFDRVEQAAYMWYKHATAIFEAMKIVKKNNFILLRYETCVSNPEKMVDRINLFLGITIPYKAIADADYKPVNIKAWPKEIPGIMPILPNYIVETGRLFGYE